MKFGSCLYYLNFPALLSKLPGVYFLIYVILTSSYILKGHLLLFTLIIWIDLVLMGANFQDFFGVKFKPRS